MVSGLCSRYFPAPILLTRALRAAVRGKYCEKTGNSLGERKGGCGCDCLLFS
jgi:hypothetical protein